MTQSNPPAPPASDCADYRPPREYSHRQELIDNVPYLLMLLLGGTVLGVGLGGSAWAWLAGVGYVAYGLAGAMWIIVFVCPFCHFYGTRQCPCGYGQIAAKLRPAAAQEQFAAKFKRHIPVIVPLWLVPPVAAAVFLVRDFTWPMTALLAAFAVNSFVVLPLLSRRYGCAHCPQKSSCPWMGSKA